MVKNRMTPQRKLIMELMNENYSHPTADEVYAAARTEDSKISRGTVYRNLNFLADSGDITRLRIPIGPDHYDFRQRDHYHFFCRKCQKVFDTKLPYMRRSV
jgi:Fe2+/Zn2+ uptake regulation proteins